MLTDEQLRQAREIVGNDCVIMPMEHYNEMVGDFQALQQQNKQILTMVAVTEPLLAETIARTLNIESEQRRRRLRQ